MLYLVWYDADSRRTAGEKIQDASAAYAKRFSAAPNVVLVNIADVTELADMEIRAERTVQPHNFWVGRSDERTQGEGGTGNG